MNVKWAYTVEKLKEAIEISSSLSEVIRYLGLCHSSTTYKTIKNRIQSLNINLDHWPKHKREFKASKDIDDIISNKVSYTHTHNLKNKLLKQGLLINKCSVCGIDSWMNKSISLQLDHINGIKLDNSLENLRLLCPNCHSQTTNYSGKKNKGKAKKYFCKTCGIQTSFKKDACLKCVRKSEEKIVWPSTEYLLEQIKTKSYLQLGRELGVSDNAIRNRIKRHHNS